jgi:hypothetical protein
MSGCPFVCLLSWNSSAPTERIFMKFEYFSKICQRNSSFVKIWQEWRLLYMKTSIHLWSYLAHLFLECEIFSGKSCIGNKKKHILCSVTFFFFVSKIVPFMKYVEKCHIARQVAWQYGACALHAGFKHILTICNTYLSSTATMVARMRLYVTLYVHCLS